MASMHWQSLLSPLRAGGKAPAGQPDRSAFEIDFDRIIFSLPFRRLQDKTQVFPLPEDDFVHNRLTHSLEVASVARSLGKKAGEALLQRHPDLNDYTAGDFGAIVSAAALAHDVGNPPFGHAGEQAISGFFAHHPAALELKKMLSEAEYTDLTAFEGNAQGFRLLNQTHHGLRLTYATLGAFSKYPRQSLGNREKGRASQKKYGFFQTEKEQFAAVAEGLQLLQAAPWAWHRHPLAFLVEAADDICYHIIDLEDGCTLGLLSLDDTIELLRPIIGKRFDRTKLQARQSLHEKTGTLRALAINELVEQTVAVFLDHEEALLSAHYDRPLTAEIPAAAALQQVIDISVDKIYRARVVLEKELAGFEVLQGLLEAYVTALLHQHQGKPGRQDKNLLAIVPDEYRHRLSGTSLYDDLRVILDYLSGMTDSHALTLFRKLKGITLPGG